MIEFTVPGIPIPQGSMKALKSRSTGKPVVVADNAVALRKWRKEVRLQAEKHRVDWIRQVPLIVGLWFELPVGSDDRAGFPPAAVKPDLDKLVRAVLDALVEGKVLVDDAQVVKLVASKRRGPKPGVRVQVQRA